MKNIKFLWIAVTLASTLVSCKKKYTCECATMTTVVVQGFTLPIPSESERKAYDARMTKKQAEAACDHEEATLQSIGKAAIGQLDTTGGVRYSTSTKCSLE